MDEFARQLSERRDIDQEQALVAHLHYESAHAAEVDLYVTMPAPESGSGPTITGRWGMPWGRSTLSPLRAADPYTQTTPNDRRGLEPMGSRPVTCTNMVGDTGIEPVTSSVSGKRATAAPIAHGEPWVLLW